MAWHYAFAPEILSGKGNACPWACAENAPVLGVALPPEHAQYNYWSNIASLKPLQRPVEVGSSTNLTKTPCIAELCVCWVSWSQLLPFLKLLLQMLL